MWLPLGICVIWFIIQSTVTDSVTDCLEGWSSYDGHCYILKTAYLSRNESRAACLEREADLVIINSEDENEFLSTLFRTSSDDASYWIGLSSNETNDLVWDDGTVVRTNKTDLLYTNWQPGKPIYNETTYEKCVAITTNGSSGVSGEWIDVPCGQKHPVVGYICETKVSDLNIRLVGGKDRYEGRVELKYNNIWGTVCDYNWNNVDARVVCRQLELPYENAQPMGHAYFGEGFGQIWLEDVECTGSESNLGECSHAGWGEHFCEHTDDAGVQCLNESNIEIRLVGGSYPYEGRLEVLFNDTWGTICDNSWNDKDASVACRQLGHPYENAEGLQNAYFEEGSGQIWLSDIYCVGSESNVTDCHHSAWGTHYCDHDDDVSIRCMRDCGVGFRQCANETCIDSSLFCDGSADCIDDSDEVTCNCKAGKYTCAPGECIPERQRCDGGFDCFDKSDEYNCHNHSNCKGSFDYVCPGDGLCLSAFVKCNDITDCADGADEQNCKCEQDTCLNGGRCVQFSSGGYLCTCPGSYFGDNCEHRQNQSASSVPSTPVTSSTIPSSRPICATDEFQCSDHICIPVSAVCDTKFDCTQREDEEEFNCLTTTKTDTRPLLNPTTAISASSTNSISTSTLIAVIGIMVVLSIVITAFAVVVFKKRTLNPNPVQQDQQELNAGVMMVGNEHEAGINGYESVPDITPIFVKYEIHRGKLELGDELGKGAFGVVYRANMIGEDASKTIVAAKGLKPHALGEARTTFLQEIQLIIEIGSHPNILGILACITKTEPIFLITEFMKYGDLLEFLRKCKKTEFWKIDGIYVMTESKQLNIAQQIACGMEFLSNTRYYHGDLAARNILIDAGLVVKISDFGMADDVYAQGYMRMSPDKRRPIKWVSLETNLQGRCSIMSDVWSYGIVLYEIVTLGDMPYPGMDGQTVVQKLKEGYRMEKPDDCTHQMYDIKKSCWLEDPETRPQFGSLVKKIEGIQNFYCDMSEEGNQYVQCDQTTSNVNPHEQPNPNAPVNIGSNVDMLNPTYGQPNADIPIDLDVSYANEGPNSNVLMDQDVSNQGPDCYVPMAQDVSNQAPDSYVPMGQALTSVDAYERPNLNAYPEPEYDTTID